MLSKPVIFEDKLNKMVNELINVCTNALFSHQRENAKTLFIKAIMDEIDGIELRKMSI
jgi:hypothetical protein